MEFSWESDSIRPPEPRRHNLLVGVQFADARKLQYADNRALDIPCYSPEYTFMEKVQAVVRKYGQFKGTRKVPTNFPRHYYDIHQLLDVEAVQKFIGTPEYLEHKKKRFKSLDHDVAKSGAFTNRRRKHPQAIRSGVFKDGSALLSRPDSI